MSRTDIDDFEWKCPYCRKWQNCHTTGNVPEINDDLECIFCKKLGIVVDEERLHEAQYDIELMMMIYDKMKGGE